MLPAITSVSGGRSVCSKVSAGVSVSGGHTQLTRTPAGRISKRNASEKPTTANFAEEYPVYP